MNNDSLGILGDFFLHRHFNLIYYRKVTNGCFRRHGVSLNNAKCEVVGRNTVKSVFVKNYSCTTKIMYPRCLFSTRRK